MSPLYVLGKRIMVCLKFLLKIALIAVPLSGVLAVFLIILSDEFLSQHIILTLSLTVLFSFTSCLLTLSKICVLKESHAEIRTIGQQEDSDLIYQNETEEAPFYELSYHCKDIGSTVRSLILRNPLEFSKFRPAYGMFLAVGFIFSLAFAAALMHIKEWNNKDDFYCSAAELIFPMIMMISVTYFVANTGMYIAEKDYDLYVPFEEFIQIPMTTFASKTVALFVTAGVTHCLLLFSIFSILASAVISSSYLNDTYEISDRLKNLLPPVYPDPQKFIKIVLAIIMLGSVNALFVKILWYFLEAKTLVLDVIEKNWQQNLAAITFLLPDSDAEELKDLKDALDRKRNQHLTAKEKEAFNYINWPIWRTKQPFVFQTFERDDPEQESVVKQADVSEKEAKDVQQPHHTTKPKHVGAEHEKVEPISVSETALLKPKPQDPSA